MIQVDTSGLRMSDLQEARLKSLFHWIAQQALMPDHTTGKLLRGNIILPFASGLPGTAKIESFHDLNSNGNGNSNGESGMLLDQNTNKT